MKVLKVFVNEKGLYGNPVGIIVDVLGEISNAGRQKIASKSGFSEVVFVNNLAKRNISIYTPQREIPFAGHAAVGAAYFFSAELQIPITELSGINGKIETWDENGQSWVRYNTSLLPHW